MPASVGLTLLALIGCGLLDSDREEECFQRVGISYDPEIAGDMKAKADAFCRSHGFDRATTIEGNAGKLLTVCCIKE
jgi:hypothetical protein